MRLKRICSTLTVPSWSRKLLDEPRGPGETQRPYPAAASIVKNCGRMALSPILLVDASGMRCGVSRLRTSISPRVRALNEIQGLFPPDNSCWSPIRGGPGVLGRRWNLKWQPFVPTGSIWTEGIPQIFEFSTPEKDAFRRDFTVNGIFYDPLDDKVIDFVGGREDLSA